MHDIDRNQLESDSEFENFEEEQFEFEEESEVFDEAELMELAGELMEVSDERELEQFLGSLIKKAGRALGHVIHSPIGRAIGGALKGVAKKALPLAGTALGGFVGGPLGARIGGGLANMAGNALGLEAESMQQEDLEFEGAKQFVRLAGAAVKHAATAPVSTDPLAAAQSAVTKAAQILAPAVLKSTRVLANAPHGAPQSLAHRLVHVSQNVPVSRGRGGRWIRRGSKIVLFGV